MTYSDYLFVNPSFLRGMARTLDIGVGLERSGYRVSLTPEQADYLALLADWSTVGSDITNAIKHCSRNLEAMKFASLGAPQLLQRIDKESLDLSELADHVSG